MTQSDKNYLIRYFKDHKFDYTQNLCNAVEKIMKINKPARPEFKSGIEGVDNYLFNQIMKRLGAKKDVIEVDGHKIRMKYFYFNKEALNKEEREQYHTASMKIYRECKKFVDEIGQALSLDVEKGIGMFINFKTELDDVQNGITPKSVKGIIKRLKG